jgi:integrase
MMIYRPSYRGADGALRHSAKYWVKYYVDNKMVRRALGVKDKRAAEQRASEIVKRDELRAVGVVDPFERHRTTVLSGHIDDFDAKLKAAGVVEPYRKARRQMLEAYVRSTGVRTLNDLDPAGANRWLSRLKDKGLGARSVNIRYQALRQFGRWLVKSRRFGYDPFESLTPLNEAADRRHVRRSLSVDEMVRLLKAAASRPVAAATKERTLVGVSEAQRELLQARGEARRLIYLTAVKTGLRRAELGRVRLCDINWTAARIRVPAPSAKTRQEQTVEVPPDLLSELHGFAPRDRTSVAPLFARAMFPSTRTFWKDLEAAGIVRQDGEGRVVDFHSLRMTFVTWLVVAGTHPKTAQVLARHASIETTMQIYTDTRLLDVKRAAASLPSLAPVVPVEIEDEVIGAGAKRASAG